jgi:vitamin B12 transporter
MPMHIAGISLELPWKSKNKELPGFLVISGHFESTRYGDTQNIIELDPNFIVNLNFNQALNKNIAAFASLRNLLNAHYVSFADYPMPGITMTIGINIKGIGEKND